MSKRRHFSHFVLPLASSSTSLFTIPSFLHSTSIFVIFVLSCLDFVCSFPLADESSFRFEFDSSISSECCLKSCRSGFMLLRIPRIENFRKNDLCLVGETRS